MKEDAIGVLAKGFACRFVEYCGGDERLNEVLHELVTDFIDKEIPIIKHDDQVEMAIALLSRVTLKEW